MTFLLKSMNKFRLIKETISYSQKLAPILCNSIHTSQRKCTIAVIRDPDFIGYQSPSLFSRIAYRIENNGFINLKEFNDAIELSENLETISSDNFMVLLQSCGRASPLVAPKERSALANKIWSTHEKFNIKLDISHYNNLLDVHNQNGYGFSPVAILEELENKNIHPNRVTYARLIHRYCQLGDIAGANTILQKMKDDSMPINQQVFQSFILGNARNKDREGMEAVVDLTKQSGIQMSGDFCGALFAAYAELNDMEKAVEIFERSIADGMRISHENFSQAMVYFGINDNNEAIEKFLPEFTGKSNLTYYLQAITTLTEHKKHDAALLLVNSLESGEVDTMTSTFYPSLLVSLDNENDKISEKCKMLVDSGKSPWAFEFAAKTMVAKGDVGKCLDFLKIMKQHGRYIEDHYFFPLMVKLRELDDAVKIPVLEEMVSINKFQFESYQNFIFPLIKAENSVELWKKIEHIADKDPGMRTAYLGYVAKMDGVQAAYEFALSQKTRKLDVTIILYIINLVQTDNIMPFVQLCSQIFSQNVVDTISGWRILIRGLVKPCLKNGRISYMEEILHALADDTQVSLPSRSGEELRSVLQYHMNSDLDHCLKKMSTRWISEKVDEEEIVKSVEDNIAAGVPPSPKAAVVYISILKKREDFAAVESLYEAYKSNEFYMDGYLLDVFGSCFERIEAIDKFKDVLNQLASDDTSFIKRRKLFKYMALLIRNDRFEDAIEMLKSISYKKVQMTGGLEILMEATAEKLSLEDVDHLKTELAPFLQEHELESMHAKYFVCKGELQKAVTSWKNLNQPKFFMTKFLVKACIEKQNKEILQDVVSHIQNTSGTFQGLITLGLSFSELGQINQAEAALSRAQPQTCIKFCTRYMENCLQQQQPEYVENLLKSTASLPSTNMNSLYTQLLGYYMQKNNVEKALGLWTLMQEQNTFPSDSFLQNLYDFLERNDVTPPFARPESFERRAPPRFEKDENSYEKFEYLLKEADFDSAVSLLQMCNKTTVTEYTKLFAESGDHETYIELCKRIDGNKSWIFLTKDLVNSMLKDSPELQEKFLEACYSTNDRSKRLLRYWFGFLWKNDRREEAKKLYREELKGKSVLMIKDEIASEKFDENFLELESFLKEDEEVNRLALEYLQICRIASYAYRNRFDEAKNLISQLDIDDSNFRPSTMQQLKAAHQLFENAGIEVPANLPKPIIYRRKKEQAPVETEN